jgi:hypothetical protein
LIKKKSEKNSCYTINSFDLKPKNNFPLINRKKRKIKTTNLLKNSIKNKLKLNEMIFGNKTDHKFPNKNNLIHKGQFRDSSHKNENKKSFNLKSSSISDKSDYDQTNSKLLLTKLINSNLSSKSNITNINYDLSNKLTINNYFSFKNSKNDEHSIKRRIINIKRNFKKSKSYFNSTNINYPKNLISNKLTEKNISNRTLSSCKSPIILKNNLNINEPIINKNKTKLFLTSNKEVFSPNEDSSDSLSISKRNISSNQNILKLNTSTNQLSKKLKMKKSHSLKKKKNI